MEQYIGPGSRLPESESTFVHLTQESIFVKTDFRVSKNEIVLDSEL
jgi:hypothetical protein